MRRRPTTVYGMGNFVFIYDVIAAGIKAPGHPGAEGLDVPAVSVTRWAGMKDPSPAQRKNGVPAKNFPRGGHRIRANEAAGKPSMPA